MWVLINYLFIVKLTDIRAPLILEFLHTSKFCNKVATLTLLTINFGAVEVVEIFTLV